MRYVVPLAMLTDMDQPRKHGALDDLVRRARSGDPNGSITAIDAQIRAFETRYEITSEEMLARFQTGKQDDTADISPIPFHRYEAIHETVMASFGNFVEHDGLVFESIEGAHIDHNTDHHVHHYDVLNGDRTGTVTIYREAGWPTLAEVRDSLGNKYTRATHRQLESRYRYTTCPSVVSPTERRIGGVALVYLFPRESLISSARD
jgi:hypothetical protein